MNGNDGQYHCDIFDEFLVPTGSKSQIGKQTGNSAVATKKQCRQTSTPVTYLVLRKTVVSIETYTLSGIWIRFKEYLNLLLSTDPDESV